MPSTKQPQVLLIQPEGELVFKGPFDDVVTTHLNLTNPSERRVCFKVKTTAPRRYCVRPNSGFIDASMKVEVAVMLQPLDADVQDKSKHKFMVQSMYAPDDAEEVESLWEHADPADLMDSKLRCVFQENTAQVQGTSEAASSLPNEPASAPTPTKPAAAAAAPAVPTESSNAGGDYQELKTLLEECKRLQAENALLKQKQKEFSPPPKNTSVATSSELTEQMKNQIILFSIIAFIFGFLVGYVM